MKSALCGAAAMHKTSGAWRCRRPGTAPSWNNENNISLNLTAGSFGNYFWSDQGKGRKKISVAQNFSWKCRNDFRYFSVAGRRQCGNRKTMRLTRKDSYRNCTCVIPQLSFSTDRYSQPRSLPSPIVFRFRSPENRMTNRFEYD